MTLRLVPTTLDHVPHVMTWVNDREVMQYFALRQEHISEDEERAFLTKLLAARNGRVFLVVRRSMQGGGRGAAMLTALIERAFGELDLHKLWLIVRKDNRRAQAMYLRAGFELEGVLKDEYCVNGRYFDMVRMGVVRDSSPSCSSASAS
ncbi:MAG: GNAT family N-acetyltransferase [Labilithrix sp.]|nr:GNAT family N-acetyltransferase [Labilithrix sp.]MCW5810013.1 GNAT family N-acetyltransferase [Labilithrix sp.]